MQDNDFSQLNDWGEDDGTFSLSRSMNVNIPSTPVSPEQVEVYPSPVSITNSVDRKNKDGITVSSVSLNVPRPKLITFQGVPKNHATPVKADIPVPVVSSRGNSSGWEDIATQIKTIMEFPNKSVLHVYVEGHETLIIDPMYKAYSWATSKENFPDLIGDSSTQVVKVNPGDKAALNGTGEDLTSLFWLIGVNAFKGETAPWLRSNESYKLMRWPNLTEFNLSLDQIYITSMLGSTPASIEELVLTSGADRAEVVNTINALSLMGILSVHPYQGAAGGLRTGKKSSSLFSKLRRKIGW